MPMKIAVIGTGVSGLGAAYALSRAHDVELFERDDRAGGHSNTVEHLVAGRTLRLDTGFPSDGSPGSPGSPGSATGPVPVLVDNDVNIMALGEHAAAHPHVQHLLFASPCVNRSSKCTSPVFIAADTASGSNFVGAPA